MATLSVEECRKYLPNLNHLSDREIIKIRDNMTIIINSILDIVFTKYLNKDIAKKQ